MDPGGADQVDEATKDGAHEEARIEGQNPQAKLLSTLVLEKEVGDDGHADCCSRADAEALKEASGHVAAIVAGFGGADGGSKGDDSADDEDDAAAIDICEGRPEEGAECQPKGRDGYGPIDLGV